MATKANFILSADDLPYAISYLKNACLSAHKKGVDYLERGSMTDHNWVEYLGTLVNSKDADFDAARLNERCDKVLTPDQWRKLRLSIRQRKYQEARQGAIKHIDIDADAHKILDEIIRSGYASSLSGAIRWLHQQSVKKTSSSTVI